MRKTHFIVPVVLLVLVSLAGCASVKTGEEFSTAKQAAKLDINFQNEPAGTLTVQNNIDESLVLFAGSISNNHVIGGIKALDKRTFEIFDDLPSEQRMGTFLLRAVKESVYRQKGSSLDKDDVVFGSIVTYDSGNRSKRTEITIQSRNGGDGIVYFENDSNLVLELRLDDPTGELIAVLSPFQRKTAIHLDPNAYGYTYFPVYRYYDKKNNVIGTISTTDLSQGQSARPVVPGSGENPQFVVFPRPDVSNIYAPVFKVRISNETDGGILFRSGMTPQLSERGIGMINSGSMDETFEFSMKNRKEIEVGGLDFDIRKGNDKAIAIPRYTYKAGYVYTITLRDDYSVIISESEPDSDLNDLGIPLVNESR